MELVVLSDLIRLLNTTGVDNLIRPAQGILISPDLTINTSGVGNFIKPDQTIKYYRSW